MLSLAREDCLQRGCKQCLAGLVCVGFRRFRRGPLKEFLEHVADVGILEVSEVLPEQRVNILNAGMQYPTRTVGPTHYGLLGVPCCIVVPLLSGIDNTGAASDATFLATGVIGAPTGVPVGCEGIVKGSECQQRQQNGLPTTSETEHPRLATPALHLVRHCSPVQFQ